jgi:hypothetical protein
VVDYVPALTRLFPGEVVVVAHGRWLDVAGPDQSTVKYARDYAYGAREDALLLGGGQTNTVLTAMLDRLVGLRRGEAFTRPLPPPRPDLRPQAAVDTIGRMVPWIVTGVGSVMGCVALNGWWGRRSRRRADEQQSMRMASAEAQARISELGARLLDDELPPPIAAERHATARTLYDQALTAEAMAMVVQVADEGLAATNGTPPPLRLRTERQPSPELTETRFLLRSLLVVIACVGVFLGITFLIALGKEPEESDPLTTAPRAAVDGLRDASVYVEPGAPTVLDTERTRRLVGDRPILVAVLRDDVRHGRAEAEDPRFSLCYDLTQRFGTDILIVFAPGPNGYGAELCTGDWFPGDHDGYGLELRQDVIDAVRYLVDRNDQGRMVDEVVHAFDTRSAADFGDRRLRRAMNAPDDWSTSPVGNVLVLSAAVFSALGTMLVFLLVRYFGTRAAHRTGESARARTRRAEVNVRLNRIADTILHPEPTRDANHARHQADAATRYLHTLHDFENARTDVALSEVEQKLDCP